MNKGNKIGYGLIGYPLSHSWSANYFREKFEREKISDRDYQLFPMQDLTLFHSFLSDHPELCGLNVTIPFKEKIIQYLDEIDQQAAEIGAVNTIRIYRKNGKQFTKGFNTDADGFIQSADFSRISHAYILGTGGASKAVAYALRESGIPVTLVSRNPVKDGSISYDDFVSVKTGIPVLIVNATPLGMFPETSTFPQVNYDHLRPGDFLYDLVYNPAETLFLEKGKEKGTRIQNGLKMLYLQAELSYVIWNNDFCAPWSRGF